MCGFYEFSNYGFTNFFTCVFFLIRKPVNIYLILHSVECGYKIIGGLRLKKMHTFQLLYVVISDKDNQ